MSYGIRVLVEGDYALFTRPELKVERYSYDFITPSAARGILESIYWKPQIKWRINKIHVLKEPVFTTILRNEVSCKINDAEVRKLMNGKSSKGYIDTTKYIQQRSATVLKDVKYIIEADFIMTGINSEEGDTPEKHYNIILRRLRNGQYYHKSYLGTREFPAKVTLLEEECPKSELIGEQDYGMMLYDMDYSDKNNIVPIFFRAKMVDGIIDLTNVEKVR
ncbi:MAG: type I-C CRISPR-associated protein Cas5 [Clostridiales bacterium]|nr:type I-C CRISPR-associated protein Cas5 [Clostridiales bacterium]